VSKKSNSLAQRHKEEKQEGQKHNTKAQRYKDTEDLRAKEHRGRMKE
jgi:hypothetical protein